MKTKTFKHFNQSGFTLIELMVVVGIIGLLATLGAAKYDGYVRKAYVANAKTGLGQIYVLEMGYSAEYSSFTSRLDAIGFALNGQTAFDMGFDQDLAGPADAPQGNAYCNMVCNSGCTNYQELTCLLPAHNSLDGIYKATITTGTFRAVAHTHFSGSFDSPDPSLDLAPYTVTIDENKNLQEIFPAY